MKKLYTYIGRYWVSVCGIFDGDGDRSGYAVSEDHTADCG